ncbi:MAG: hypothetical protein ACE5OR_13305, partial [bacterium]
MILVRFFKRSVGKRFPQLSFLDNRFLRICAFVSAALFTFGLANGQQITIDQILSRMEQSA